MVGLENAKGALHILPFTVREKMPLHMHARYMGSYLDEEHKVVWDQN